MIPPAYVAFDCETSGLDSEVDELLQLAGVRFEHGRPVEEWCRLVRPSAPVSPGILRLTGLDPAALAIADTQEQVLPAFRTFVGDLPLVAHNAPFDRGFVAAGLKRLRLAPLDAPIFDTHELVRLTSPLLPSRRLGNLAANWAIPLDHAHDALADARATGLLFARLCDELASLDSALLGTLEYLLRPVGGPLYELVRRAFGFPGGEACVYLATQASATTPTPSATPTATETQPEAAVSAQSRPRSHRDFDVASLAALLLPGSRLAEHLDDFEPRPGQAELLTAVARALRDGRHLLAEAGTGTGKTLAYLLPALAWARATGERIVVATHTVNLQEQLLKRDIPLALSAVPLPVAVLKGRSHYLCLKLWAEVLAQPLAPAAAPFLARVAAWVAATATGDRAELAAYGEEQERWDLLSTDAVACPGKRCRWYDRCFLFRARRRAEEADLVVVSHALLLSNLKVGGQLLPEHQYVIIDEAHHLEDVAAEQLGVTLGERRLVGYLADLASRCAALRRLWLSAATAAPDDPAASPPPDAELRRRALAGLDAVESALQAARIAADDFFSQLRPWIAARGGTAQGRSTVRLEPHREEDEAWLEALAPAEGLKTQLDELTLALQGAALALDGETDTAQQAELQALGAQARDFGSTLQLLICGEAGWVTWAEAWQRRSGTPTGGAILHGAPIAPAPLLAERLFAARASVVLTSATLRVGESFAFTAERLGLAAQTDRLDTLTVPSPYDFRRQALLCLPRGLPNPRRFDPQQYAAAIGPFLVQLFRLTHGRALCLFTAHRTLRALYAWCKGPLEREGIVVLGQGIDGGRGRLAEALREPGQTVVFGAASFWEGIDVPGAALSCVVLAQLPFPAPDIPLVQARVEALDAVGRSSFADLTLPDAVLRFKQGFGRLIRGGRDQGVAVCLDERLTTARYGHLFLESLPGPQIFTGSADAVLERVGEWFAREG